MFEVYKRVSVWNSLRYDREYNHELTLNLLLEEYTEYLEATEEVKEIDGLCDMVYVALGGLWKLNMSADDLQRSSDIANDLLKDFIDESFIDPIYIARGLLDMLYKQTTKENIAIGLQAIAQLALTQMSGYRLDFKKIQACMLAVCDANDSKSIKKTPSNVKANIDKGAYFIPPEVKLQAILNTREELH